MKKSLLNKYARLIVDYGINLEKGQDVLIQANTEIESFVLLTVEECYKRGARKVRVEWLNQALDKLNYKYRSIETLKEVDKWEVEKVKDRVKKLPALIWLDSDDPDGLVGTDAEKVGAAVRARGLKIKKYRDEMEGKYQWCIAAVPSVSWAKKLFPSLSSSSAVEKLWEKILFCSRVSEDTDPVENWKKHDASLKDKCSYLNSKNIKSLHYTSSNGTDFTVGLIDGGLFMGGGENTIGKNIYFQPNIPSEECFTSPKRGSAEGVVYSTMPLCYNGNLIENFSITFKEGKAIKWTAEKNEELLGKLLTMDEGASMLGECALVPYSSPIRESGILFYNTLFDENAACHLAFGAGFPSTLKGYEKMSKAEWEERGINDSMIHIDFMIGNADLNIEATTFSGEKFPVFTNGNWAF